MSDAVHDTIHIHALFRLTRHAWARMGSRGISPEAVRLVLRFGRVVHVRGAAIYAVGRKEVERLREQGTDLARIHGVQVVCADSSVLTVYRNRDFRSLRPRSRRTHRSK